MKPVVLLKAQQDLVVDAPCVSCRLKNARFSSPGADEQGGGDMAPDLPRDEAVRSTVSSEVSTVASIPG